MRLLSLLILLCLPGLLFAQTVLLMHNVDEDEDTDMGPGKLSHAGGVFGAGFLTGPTINDSVQINFGKSFQLQYGGYSKIQPTKFFGLGIESIFGFNQYSIKQTDNKVFANSFKYKREKFWALDYTISPFIRLTYTLKRGDSHGVYTDFAFWGSYQFITRRTYRVNDTNLPDNNSTKVFERKLKYINKLQFGPEFRFGIGGITLYAKYRLSNHFKEHDGYRYPELPRFAFGLKIYG